MPLSAHTTHAQVQTKSTTTLKSKNTFLFSLITLSPFKTQGGQKAGEDGDVFDVVLWKAIPSICNRCMGWGTTGNGENPKGYSFNGGKVRPVHREESVFIYGVSLRHEL